MKQLKIFLRQYIRQDLHYEAIEDFERRVNKFCVDHEECQIIPMINQKASQPVVYVIYDGVSK